MGRRVKWHDKALRIFAAVAAAGVAFLMVDEIPSLIRYVKMEKM